MLKCYVFILSSATTGLGTKELRIQFSLGTKDVPFFSNTKIDILRMNSY